MQTLSRKKATPTVEARLRSCEEDLLALFVRFAQLLGAPNSLGSIYGLCFVTVDSLTLDDVVRRLRISKGSASQGLRFLRSIGAIKPVAVPGDRREHYVAEMELRKLVTGLLREKVAPHLASGSGRLQEINANLEDVSGPGPEELRSRVDKLSSWHRKAQQLLPFLQEAAQEE